MSVIEPSKPFTAFLIGTIIEQIINAPSTRLIIFFVLPSVIRFDISVQISAEAQIAEVTARISFILHHRPL